MKIEKLYFQFKMSIMLLYLLRDSRQSMKYIIKNLQVTYSILKMLLKTFKLNLLMKEKTDCRSKKKKLLKDLDQDQELLRMRTKNKKIYKLR